MPNVNPNQFEQAPIQGQLDLNITGQGRQIAGIAGEALIAGQAVKLDTSNTGKVPKFVAAAATDVPFGFVAYDTKNDSVASGDRVIVAMDGAVMWMTAGAAINPKAKLEIVAASKKVITNAGTNKLVGVAIDKAAADGDLIRVYILSLATAQ